MKILLFGKNGQVGGELLKSLASFGEVFAFDRESADITDAERVDEVIWKCRPEIIFNAAAYTAVDAAENNQLEAASVNAVAPRVIAAAAEKISVPLFHYSTDYVFDGKKGGAYTELDPPAPVNIYGESKLRGEEAVQKNSGRHFIIRTSWVFSDRRSNFLKTVLQLAREKDELKIVNDQIGCPTSAEMVACVSSKLLEKFVSGKIKKGIYHLSSSEGVSWCDFAKEIVTVAKKNTRMQLKVSPEKITPILTSDYPTKAKRPADTRLDSRKLSKELGITIPSWRPCVRKIVGELAKGEEWAARQ